MRTKLTLTHPQLAAEWADPEHEIDEFTASSLYKALWQCRTGEACGHIWPAQIRTRTHGGSPCPACRKRARRTANNLTLTHPPIAAEWADEKHSAQEFAASSPYKALWQCRSGEHPCGHQWRASISSRAYGNNGCPRCRPKGHRRHATQNLAITHPQIAAEWADEQQTPEQVTAGSGYPALWCCRACGHSWRARVGDRVRRRGCPQCAGRVTTAASSLAATHPELAAEWADESKTAEQVSAGASYKALWQCRSGEHPCGHIWPAQVNNRAHGTGCPACSGQVVTAANNLAATHPQLAAEWADPDRSAEQLTAGVDYEALWQCRSGEHPCGHIWRAKVVVRAHGTGTGCPRCNVGFTVAVIRDFVASLGDHVAQLTEAERYVLCQQAAGQRMGGNNAALLREFIRTGALPEDDQPQAGQLQAGGADANAAGGASGEDALDGDLDAVELAEESLRGEFDDAQENDERPPELRVTDTLSAAASLSGVLANADAEAVEFLIASRTGRLWAAAFEDQRATLQAVRRFNADGFASQVKDAFLAEYEAANAIALPAGYAFSVDGHGITEPNLMQRLIAVRVRDRGRVGNWSGTGAGKTLSAILASRLIDARLTVVCCPNDVVDGWAQKIADTYPDSLIAHKTFAPNWQAIARRRARAGHPGGAHRYLILNYEAFQQPDSAGRLHALLDSERLDFVCVDEIHQAKQRRTENLSLRRERVGALIAAAAQRNPQLRVLGMSATPVINNLQEGKSLIELITGQHHDELSTRATVHNCMALHQQLMRLGLRWKPRYNLELRQELIDVTCEPELLDELRELGHTVRPLQIERILTQARIPAIIGALTAQRCPTLIYTHYIDGIDALLKDAITNAGMSVGFYRGADKSGLERFKRGEVDVLIATAAIATGVDGLQHVCDRLIVNVLPWTNAEFEQLKGRLYRQGQRSAQVQVLIPVISALLGSGRWSWCERKLARLRHKESLADSAVDGVVPAGHLRTPEQAARDALAWLHRLHEHGAHTFSRPALAAVPEETEPLAVPRGGRLAAVGEFSRLTQRWGASHSQTTHARLAQNPREWERYHELYRSARERWPLEPCRYLIEHFKRRSGYRIGDFGCGEAALQAALRALHTVYSFDHVAISEQVLACDMASVPMDSGSLDAAVFSLSLMGQNLADYLREANRLLRLDGQLHIVEPSYRFTDPDDADLAASFCRSLKRFGFTHIEARTVGSEPQFVYISAQKSAEPESGAELSFGEPAAETVMLAA